MHFIKKIFFQTVSLPRMFIKNFFNTQDYLSSFVTFILLIFLVFYYGSLYYFAPLDSSWIATTIPENRLTNSFGYQGAWLSSIVFYSFGLGSWILPLPLFYLCCSLLKKEEKLLLFSRLFFSWFLMIISVIFFLSHYKNFVVMNGVSFLAGGSIGLTITDTAIRNWGLKGSNIIAILSLVYSFILTFNLSFLLKDSGNFLFKHILRVFKSVKSFVMNKLPLKKTTLVKKTKTTNQETTKTIKIFRKLSKESLKEIFRRNTLSYNKTGSEEKEIAKLIIKTLAEFGVEGNIIDYTKGPSLTIYNFTPAEGVRQSKVLKLIDDLALALKAHAIIIKPSKNKRALEIQVPNANPTTVFLGDIIHSEAYHKTMSPLTLAFGVTEKGEPICEDLKEMPHILIAGSTGTGKSVCLNSFICSILTKASPDMVRFIMIDPKMLELSIYDKIPHMLAPVITTDLNKATAALKWAVFEMERRYEILQKMEVKSLNDYNEKIKNEQYHPEEGEEEEEPYEKLPYVVLIIDELADLMLMASKDIEHLIQRLSQKARACGIHLILATQRPSVDVVTGVIKANLPCRLSFRVVSRYDSRTILDQVDAEKLLGKGDMFFMKPGNLSLQRIQCAYISTEEVAALVESLVVDDNPYDASVVKWIERNTEQGKTIVNIESSTDLYTSAKNIGRQYGTVSTSFLQRQLKVGYNKAADLIEKLEQEGLISKAEGSKKRKWIAD